MSNAPTWPLRLPNQTSEELASWLSYTDRWHQDEKNGRTHSMVWQDLIVVVMEVFEVQP